MPNFTINWSIDLEAANAVDAAGHALTIQRDLYSTATVFAVTLQGAGPVMIDLCGTGERTG